MSQSPVSDSYLMKQSEKKEQVAQVSIEKNRSSLDLWKFIKPVEGDKVMKRLNRYGSLPTFEKRHDSHESFKRHKAKDIEIIENE